MKRIIYILVLAFFTISLSAQDEKEIFTIEKEIPHTPVADQGSTGTCWSFATTSFIESEIMRKGFEETDLSEMYFVNYNYLNKAFQYLLYHGNNNYGQGSVSHDVMKIVREQGIASYESYPGEMVDGEYKHRELIAQLLEELKSLNKKREDFDASDLSSLEPILKKQIGKLPKKIKSADGKITPGEYRDQFQLNPDDYIEISSFNHHPFYQQFVLEIPDNWAHQIYYNLPLDELIKVMYYALNNGYSIAWDGDTSEKTFQHKKGKADLPVEEQGKADQLLRQEKFLNRSTTDDHLMHLVGLSKDANGTNCFYTKNSWGADSNDYGGYLHMTEDYVRLKTIAIMVHKDAVPNEIKSKLGL